MMFVKQMHPITHKFSACSVARSNSSMDWFVFYFVGMPSLFYYYLGEYRILLVYVYAILLFITIIQFNGLRGVDRVNRASIVIVLSLIILIVATSGNFASPLPYILGLRLYFGVLVFIAAFSVIRFRVDVVKLTMLLSIVTIIEFILVGLYPSLIDILPNYDITSEGKLEQTLHEFGVYSFGGSRTNTGCLLFALFVYLETYKKNRDFRWLPLIASVMAGSGTAFVMISLYGLWCFRHKIVPLVLIAILILNIVSSYDADGIALMNRFNYEYFIFLMDYKEMQIFDLAERSSLFSILFGLGSDAFLNESKEVSGYGMMYGDFVMLSFFAIFGIVGILCLVIPIATLITKHTAVPIGIILLGSFHYHVLFSMPGQMITALIITDGLLRYCRICKI